MNATAASVKIVSTDEEGLFQREHLRICRRTDKLIAFAMCLQWPGAIVASLMLGATTWNGSQSSLHPHVIAAIYLGGLITIMPVLLAYFRSGTVYTRHIMAACQLLMSGLLIDVTGGRIETHFHVFGSLAFLAFYLDWRVLVTATLVTLLDHSIIGYYAPAVIFGTAFRSNWRLFEHVLWVVFCDSFLITSCVQSLKGLRAGAAREANQEDLLFQAYHDALTGLGNRLLLKSRMAPMVESVVEGSGGFALISIDLDRFKEVNDTLGHQAGDMLLIEMSKRLQSLIRGKDTLVRMGGDEFALLLDGCTDASVAERIAARIIESLNEPFLSGSNSVHVGASVGICLYPEAASGVEQLFQHADLALYKAKNAGRNAYFVFNKAMQAETELQMTLEHRFRGAVKDELLEIHYQPIVAPKGTLLGFEALLRWNDPVLGKITPDVFIPLAEKSGLIVPLGTWVLRQACAQAVSWHKSKGERVKISVNVASLQLSRKDFTTTVLTILRESGLAPDLLDLELTETAMIDSHGPARESLELLRKFGVGISIDDFGTGYSSLSYLRDLPIHRLKIDRAFVKDIATSEAARALISGMIEMAHNLNLRVVAEGVEELEQMDFLRQAGCDEVQGFLISKAVRSDDAAAFIHPEPVAPAAPDQKLEDRKSGEDGPILIAAA